MKFCKKMIDRMPPHIDCTQGSVTRSVLQVVAETMAEVFAAKEDSMKTTLDKLLQVQPRDFLRGRDHDAT